MNVIETISIGNTILQKAFEEKVSVTPMKLQKLMYCLYKEYYKTTKKPLFGERFEAWRYGPVLPSIYIAFKKYGANPITGYAKNEDGKVFVVDNTTSGKFWDAFRKVWDLYKGCNGIELSSFTHREDTAWRKAIVSRNLYLRDQDIEEESDFL